MTKQEVKELIASVDWDKVAEDTERVVCNCRIRVEIGGQTYEASEDEETPELARKYAIRAIKKQVKRSMKRGKK